MGASNRLKCTARRLLRAALVRWARGGRRGRSPPAERTRVYILLMHAWGMGGTIRSALNLAGHLARRHDVEILSLVRRRDEPFLEFPAGVEVTAIDDQRPHASSGVARLGRRFLGRRSSVLVDRRDRARRVATLWTDVELARALRRRGSGVLVATRPGLSLLAASVAPRSLARVAQEHMHLSAHPRPLRRAIARGYRGLDAVVVLTASDLAAYRDSIDGPLVTVIPNAVPDLGAHGPGGSGRTVMSAGRLTRQKGFERLIAAFAQVAAINPDWRLRIYGRGPLRKRLVRLVGELGLARNVTVAGPVERIGEAMARASIFALSSRFEGFPMVLLEAMSVGLPVVSFDCPTGPREIVEQRRNGLLVPEGDVDGLAAAIVEMIDDEELRRHCSEGALRTAQRYSLDAIGAQWDALIAQLSRARAG